MLIKWQVINKLIENENDRYDAEGGKHFFDKVEISRVDWDVVKRLNEILQVSLMITSMVMKVDTHIFPF